MQNTKYVHDARTGRFQGPFDAEAAQKYCADLNEMVFRNTLGEVLPRPALIKGPFYVRDEGHTVYAW